MRNVPSVVRAASLMGISRVAAVGCALISLVGILAAEAQTEAAKPRQQGHARYQLIIATDLACSVKVDDSDARELSPDEPLIVRVALGDHVLTAISRDGQDKWQTIVQVDKPRSKAILIPLLSVKQIREQNVHAVARELDQARERARVAADRMQQQARASADQEGKRREMADIRSQIDDLRETATDDEQAAQNYEEQAQLAEDQCSNLPAGVRCYGSAAAIMDKGLASQKRQEVQRINAQINELRGQLQALATQ